MPGFASTALDVVIGLSFVFLVVSLVAASVREAIASFLNARAARLEDAIAALLGEPDLADRFFRNPLVEQLSTHHAINNKKVGSYLPSRTFALALLDTLRHDQAPPQAVADAEQRLAAAQTADERRAAQDALAAAWRDARTEPRDELAQAWRLAAQLPDGALRRQVLDVLQSAGADVTKLRIDIERVYDEAMGRVSGWYKRRSQYIIVCVAILIAAAGNVDAIAIGGRLWKDPAVRAGVVAVAQRTDNTKTETSEASAIDELQQLQLPVGWGRAKNDPRGFPTTWQAGIGKLVGILITAFATLLGAPFWFSALSRLAPLRSTGAKPATTARTASAAE